MKATAIAPSNIAFIKYWGKTDPALRLPTNSSISMNLSALQTTTTVEFSPDYSEDTVVIDGKQREQEHHRVSIFLDLIRAKAQIQERAKVVSINTFPSGTGLSSSASGFAALTVAATAAAGLPFSESELTRLARQGSGSACRSIPSGFVEWRKGESDETSTAVSLYPPDHWALSDVVAIVSDEKKDVSTTAGQERADSSPFFTVRLAHIEEKITRIKQYLKDRDFDPFGEALEAEAFELHAMMMTSQPALFYFLPQTVEVIRSVRHWRSLGLPVYITLNTGQDVHCICQKQDAAEVQKRLQSIVSVKQVISNEPCGGTQVTDTHLF